MVEQLLSPGSLMMETDTTFVPTLPPNIGAAIVGPTVKGKVNIPTQVTSYNEYVALFGSEFEENDERVSYFTSIAAYNYFQEGGDSLIVTRIASGSHGPASASIDISGSVGDLFTLETIAEGENQNSETELSKYNIVIEIASVNETKETFTVLVRRGSDDTILERFSNLSLDNESPNYITKVIGDMSYEVEGSGSDAYVKSNGSYPNNSRYIRVKSIDGEGLPVEEVYKFDGGTGDINDTYTNFYESHISGSFTQGVASSDYTDAFYLLSNQDEYQFNVIVTPGLVYETHSTEIDILKGIIESRGDSIYPVDLVTYGASIAEVTTEADKIDSSYLAAYWPWVQVKEPSIKKMVWVPASTLIPGVYVFNDITGETWSAPAGINRGGLSLVNQAERKLTTPQRDTLYQSKVNPIATFPGEGIVVFGQKTLQEDISALDRINVRRLLIDIKGFVKGISNNLIFEQNSLSTRNSFINQVEPRLENIQQRGGLYAYKVVMDESLNDQASIDRYELRGAIYIQPTKTAEYVYVDFIITPTGAEFGV